MQFFLKHFVLHYSSYNIYYGTNHEISKCGRVLTYQLIDASKDYL